MSNKKLEDIEITLTHQEQQIAELNDIITDQWKQIEFLNIRLNKVLSKIDLLENGGGDVKVDKPPHY